MHEQLVEDFMETMEAYKVMQLMMKTVQITGGQLTHDKSHAWCIRRSELFSNFLQASFTIREGSTVIDCSVVEESLGIVVEDMPELSRFEFTMPNVSYNEKKKPGKRIMECTLNSIEELQIILPIISRWLKE